MTKSIIINEQSFQDEITRFETSINNIKDYLDKIDKEMDNIDGNNDTWKSKVATNIHDDHLELKKRFNNINTELSSYLSFLKKTLEDYKIQENNINTAIENNSSLLDVNE